MSLNAVHHAVRQEGRIVMEIAVHAPGHRGKCSRQSVLNVVRKLRCLSNHVRVDRYIVVISTAKSDRAANDAPGARLGYHASVFHQVCDG